MQPTTIGPFQIEREIGRGGMGIVYLARDTRLDRLVAIKTLPEHLLDDPDRLARFQREAKTLAQLNHSNIGGIHGIEEVGDHGYLVLEYVEGTTLAELVDNGPLPLDDALDIAAQIAAGLEAAHDAGIIHRDLKPANIKITPNGKVKVLDFGLAKASDGTGASSSAHPVQTQSPTVTRKPVHSPTIPGAIMGTAPYMSPEQARGKSVDKRSDIWSFGVVLYEMLTGISPFHGETVSDSIGAILHRDVDLSQLPATTPSSVRHVISRCLQRDKNLRYRDIGDAALDLRATEQAAESRIVPGSPARSRSLIVAALTVIALAAAAGWLLARFGADRPTLPVVQFEITAPEGYTLVRSSLCLSPSGDAVVFAAETGPTRRLFVRTVDDAVPRVLPGTDGGGSPFFSPDGRSVGFIQDGNMMRMPIAGGPAVTIAEASARGAAWLPDGTIVFAGVDRLLRVSENGGEPTVLAKSGPDAKTNDGSMLVLGFMRIAGVPGGAPYVLGSIWHGDTLEAYALVAVSLADGAIRPVLRNATDGRFIDRNTIVFQRDASLMMVGFDPDRGVTTTEPVPVLDGVRCTTWADSGYWDVSASGSLAYMPGGRAGPGRRLVRVDETGASTPVMDDVDAIVGGVRVSPDGRFATVITLRKRIELWVLDLARRQITLVSAEGESWNPVWTPDGSALVFVRIVPGRKPEIVRKFLDGRNGSSAETLVSGTTNELFPEDFTPDGARLVVVERVMPLGTESSIATVALPPGAPTGTPAATALPAKIEPVPGLGPTHIAANLSPDGKAIAFVSYESGRNEVYLRAFPGPGPRTQVSAGGGRSPLWSDDGKRLFFLDRSETIQGVDVETGAGLKVSEPRALLDTTMLGAVSDRDAFDTLPGGGFVMVQSAPWETEPVRIRIVLNWKRELEQKLRAASGSTR